MFGKKKMYKKGLADAMNAYQDFGSKQEEGTTNCLIKNSFIQDSISP